MIEAGTPDARYAILELADGNWRVTFRHVPYDHEAMAALARQNGQPEIGVERAGDRPAADPRRWTKTKTAGDEPAVSNNNRSKPIRPQR